MAEEIVQVGTAAESSRTDIEEAGTAIVPLLGLVVALGNPSEVAQAIGLIRDAKRKLDEFRSDLERVLVEEAARQGTKTLHLEKGDVVITGGPTVEYDIEELQKLLDAGLPEERYARLVKTEITYRIDKRVINQLLGSRNEAYSKIITRAAETVERPYRVSVK